MPRGTLCALTRGARPVAKGVATRPRPPHPAGMSRLILPDARPTRFTAMPAAKLQKLRQRVHQDPQARSTCAFRAKVNGTSYWYEVDRVIESLMPSKDEERVIEAVRRERG